jgi:hypothetical protein
MRQLVFFLEEASAAAMLGGLGMSKLASKQRTRKFRDPDQLVSPKEELKKLTSDQYQPVAGSRAIGRHLDPENTRSRSFRNLVLGIRHLIGT